MPPIIKSPETMDFKETDELATIVKAFVPVSIGSAEVIVPVLSVRIIIGSKKVKLEAKSILITLEIELPLPKVMEEKPSLRRPNSVSSRCKEPAALVPIPMDVVLVFG